MRYQYPFNPDRYFYLKNKKINLIKQNNNQRLTKSEYFELSDYNKQYFHYLCWNQKSIFLTLIKKFVKNELDSDDFYIEFNSLWRTNQKLLSSLSLKTLKNVKIDSQSSSFSLLIENIGTSLDLYYEMAPDDDDSYDIALKNAVSEEYAIFFNYESAIDVEIELDPLLIEGSVIKPYNDREVLRFLMIFLTIITSVAYCFFKPEIFHLFS